MTIVQYRRGRRPVVSKEISRGPAATALDFILRLDSIADRLRLLRPDSHNPDKYFEDKSELLRDIGRLRADIRSGVVG